MPSLRAKLPPVATSGGHRLQKVDHCGSSRFVAWQGTNRETSRPLLAVLPSRVPCPADERGGQAVLDAAPPQDYTLLAMLRLPPPL
ncbi:MAG TPA: hypothetical protein PKN95_11255 [Verrucomicrobiota bacterium]|nr:hypothetical protein [Verrucomicrobiota bacterium]HNT14302.1 hypothetical protein [Verrucomicrobiota bacterium]